MMKNENEYKANSMKRGEKGFHAKGKKGTFSKCHGRMQTGSCKELKTVP